MEFNEFIEKSSIAENVKPEGRVMIHRTELTPAKLLEMRKKGEFGVVQKKGIICQLEVGGKILAQGKIIRKGGRHYFKVKEVK